ncbi:MAG: hypothetical protein F4Y24_01470 [Gemmatimonadetes bacterium]|nr:hypothetical protein [Gemmatimonadota bacterium]MYG22567.1 hypothetical protein [Gemmatimonadota bacterium]MYJ38900.1 hypothetical protein [Gemmatimonadota bacterium]
MARHSLAGDAESAVSAPTAQATFRSFRETARKRARGCFTAPLAAESSVNSTVLDLLDVIDT